MRDLAQEYLELYGGSGEKEKTEEGEIEQGIRTKDKGNWDMVLLF